VKIRPPNKVYIYKGGVKRGGGGGKVESKKDRVIGSSRTPSYNKGNRNRDSPQWERDPEEGDEDAQETRGGRKANTARS